MIELVKNQPCLNGIYLIKEYGDKNMDSYTDKEKKEYKELKKQNRTRGFYTAKYDNIESTKGGVEIFDSNTNMYSSKTIYRNSKGFYIKKGGNRYFLQQFKVEGES